MGMMTVVSILNDAWLIIKENPEQFIKNIEDGMHNYSGKTVNMYPVGNHANPMEVHRSFHNSLNQVLIVGGNHMENLIELRPTRTNDDFYLAYKMTTANLAKSLAESTIREIQDEFAQLVYENMKLVGRGVDDISKCASEYSTFQKMDEKTQNAVIWKIGSLFNKNE